MPRNTLFDDVEGYSLMYSSAQLRRAVANYMATEGCDCCQNIDGHKKAKAQLAKMLDVPKYSDGSGYDFYRFKTKKRNANREKDK